jgi:NAD(P)-dependent dehydrogenase (short-subunit alcohol dehydrogenase family)
MTVHDVSRAGTSGGVRLSLAGKTALVTGAGRGIGAGIVEVFLEAGANVIVNARTDTYLSKLVARLTPTHLGRIFYLTGDLASAEGAAEFVIAAMSQVGDIDVLVNGVGDAIMGDLINNHGEPEADAQIRRNLDLNLMSAIHCTRLIGPSMIRRKRGRVINLVGVIGGISGEAGLSVYAAGKAGLIGFTRSLAREWAPHGITVNAIAPGVFPDRESIMDLQQTAIGKSLLGRIPLGRFGDPRELGYLACYLASDLAAYVTGQILAHDGGLSA